MKNLSITNTELPSIEELLLLSVKISKKDDDGNETLLGTGTIAYDGVDYFVLTAAHCFRDEKGNDDCELKDIIITLSEDGGNPQTIYPKSWVKSNVETDAALIQIDNPNINFDILNGLILLGKEFEANACVYGYTEGIKNGRRFIFERKSVQIWSCKEGITANGGYLHDTIKGLSGGGLFTKTDGVIYCLGYVKKTYDDNAKLDDVIIYPMSNFKHEWGINFINDISEVRGREIRAIECNEDKAKYAELWNELYDGIYYKKDVSSTIVHIKDAKRNYPLPKNVNQQEQVITLLLRKQEAWDNCFREAFLLALQDRGLWVTLYGKMPEQAGDIMNTELAKRLEERGETLTQAPQYIRKVQEVKDDEEIYENMLRAAFSFDFSTMHKILTNWNPQNQWIVARSIFLNLIDKDVASIEQMKCYLQTKDLNSRPYDKFLATTAYNLILDDFRNKLPYKPFWDKGIDGISDILGYIAGNIDKSKTEVQIYGIHHSLIFGGEDITSFPEAIRVVQTIINAGMLPCMRFTSIISKENWMKVARYLYRYMPYTIVFYTLTYTDEKILRRIAQELCYTEEKNIQKILPDLMNRLLSTLRDDNRPKYFFQGILYMTREWYVAIPEDVWYDSFMKNVLTYFCHDIVTSNVSHRDSLFLNIEEALKYIKQTDRRCEVLKMLLDTLEKNSYLVNRLVESMDVDNDLLSFNGVSKQITDAIKSYPLKDMYKIIYRFFTRCEVNSEMRDAVHCSMEKDSFSFGQEEGTVFGMLSYVLEEKDDITKLKSEIMKMDMWNCGISGDRFTDPEYAHLEMYNPAMRFTEEEWSIIKKNIEKNIILIHDCCPKSDEIIQHFKKQYIVLLSNMKYFVLRIMEKERFDVGDIIGQIDYLLSELRLKSNVIELLSSDDYDTVVDGVWYLRDCFVDEGIEITSTGIIMLINRVLIQTPTALEACMSLLAAMVINKPEEMTERFGVSLLQILKKYSVHFNYEKLFVRVPAMFGWLKMIANSLSGNYGEDEAVKYWLTDEAVNRFNYCG